MLNEATAKNLGTTVEEAIGKTDFDFFPEESAREYYEDEETVMKSGKPLISKVEKTGPRGEERWNYTTKMPIFDEKGNVVGIMGINRDFTDRKRAEERAELFHTLLTHDTGNIICATQGYLRLLDKMELLDKQKEMVKKILKMINECSDLIKKVRRLKRIEESKEISAIDLNFVLREAVSENEARAEERGIKIDYKGTDVTVKGSPLLKEAFSNLIENSILHAGCKEIWISARKKGKACTVTIEDDGRAFRMR